MKALEQHLLLQDHSYFSKPEDIHKTSDKVKILFAEKLKDAKIAEQNYLTSSIGNYSTSTSGSIEMEKVCILWKMERQWDEH